jgi:ThiJ/PfpI family-like
VVFAAEQAGTLPEADPRLLTGVLFGQLGAAAEARSYYAELTEAAEFTATQAWAGMDAAAFDGLLLPGGHAPVTPRAAASWPAAAPPACPSTWSAPPT